MNNYTAKAMEAFVFTKEVEFLADCIKHRNVVLFDELNADNAELHQNSLKLTKDSLDLYDDYKNKPELEDDEYFIVEDCSIDEIHHDIISIFGSDEVLIKYTVGDDEQGSTITIMSMCGDTVIYIDCEGHIDYCK